MPTDSAALPSCPTHGVCPPCREGWGHYTTGRGYSPTIESERAAAAQVDLCAGLGGSQMKPSSRPYTQVDADPGPVVMCRSSVELRVRCRLPRGCWQAFLWYTSATLMTLAHHGVNGGHASTFVATWFAGTAALYALSFVAESLEQGHV